MIRTWVRFQLEVASILHIGSGTDRKDEQSESKVAEIVRGNSTPTQDAGVQPWIPGSTLKGALRKVEADLAVELFGEAHAKETHGAGRVLVFGTALENAKIIVVRRTRVHGGTGVAEANKLFAKEYVDTGATCQIELCIRPLGDDKLDDLTASLLTVLRHFAGPDGLEIASNKADSFGRMRLVGKVELTTERVSFDEGVTADDPVVVSIEPVSKQAEVIELFCRGPFLVHDPSLSNSTQDDENKANYLRPLVSKTGDPRILETGVSGALRKRAAWLTALDKTLTNEVPVETTSGPSQFCTVKRLFGDEGYRAKLKVMVKEIKTEGECEFPSVKLNPLTQGPADGALFFVRAHYGVSFSLQLSSRSPGLSDDERKLLDALKTDIEENGLQLGFGGSKGFGWFEKKGTKRPVPDASELKKPEPVAVDSALSQRMPDPRVTLPYRTISVDPDNILLPEDIVVQAFGKPNLHDEPLEAGVSGHVDVSWLFDTPMLIGATKDRNGITGPIKMGQTYLLPGPTIRGNLRAYLAAITNSRLQNLDDVKPKYASKDPISLQKKIDEFRKNKAHNPAHDATYTPDFVEALFGFIHEAEGVESNPNLHQALHLKSRLSFEPAYLVNEHNAAKDHISYTLVLGGPTGESKIYDSIARKVYPADYTISDRVTDRFQNRRVDPQTESAATLRFLHPSIPGNRPKNLVPMHFRGRIRFHNVTMAELGALLFAVTLGNRPHAKHRIGHAKAFGAGRCRAAMVDLTMKRHADQTKEYVVRDAFKPLTDSFERHAQSAKDLPSWEEVQVTDLQGYGKTVKQEDVLYQTWSTLKNRDEKVIIHGLDQFADDARMANGGRLAAALKPATGAKK
ncbi:MULTISPECIES: RAMP superfamily CRISPR-associated protein [unclassified Marinovum]